MAIKKKQIFYEVDPRYYSDASGNGTGDLIGLSNKLDYFNYLGVNSIILQNVLSSDSDDLVQNYVRVAKDLGTLKDLKKVISMSTKKGLKILIDISIGSIKDTHKWFKNATNGPEDEFSQIIDFKAKEETENISFKYSQKRDAYYAFDEETKEIPLNWKNEEVSNQFVRVLKFWIDLGVAGFVFKDFHYLMDAEKKEPMSEDTLRELRKFYREIKELNDNIIIIGKSSIIGLDSSRYTSGSTQVFDYFMPTQISKIGTDAKYGNDAIGTFRVSKLVKELNQAIKNKQNIITFGNENSGRINERWGNKGQFSDESAKALGMLLLLTPSSASIYYGDEIGSLNIGLTHLDDFQDETMDDRKHRLLIDGLKEKQFMNAQVLQNSINARSLMSWNDEKNGGFSKSDKTITPVSYNYKEINVKNQYMDANSTLHFYKELIRIIDSSGYKAIIDNGKFKISAWISGVIKIKASYAEKKLIVYINLTNKTKIIKKPKLGKIILSTKAHKTYNELPRTLDEYEGIIITENIDFSGKQETLELKLSKQEQDQALKEEQKAKEQLVMKVEAEKLAEKQALLEKANKKIKAKKAADKAIKDEETKLAKQEIAESKMQEKQKSESEKASQTDHKEVHDATSDLALENAREQSKAERRAVKEIRKNEKIFDIMEEEILESDRTTLTEDEIASTIQIEPDEFDDFEAFLGHDENKNKK